MSEPPDPAPPPNAPKRRRVRFSLRTMLLSVLLLASALALWQNWQPWYKVCTITKEGDSSGSAFFNEDASRVIWLRPGFYHCTVHLVDASTGREISTKEISDTDIHALGVYGGRPILATAGKVQEHPPEEPWRIDFRSRHPQTIALNFQIGTLEEVLDALLKDKLTEKFSYNQDAIESGRLQHTLSLKKREGDPLVLLDQVLALADLAAEFEDGTIQIVRSETWKQRRRQPEQRAVQIWDLESGKQMATLGQQLSHVSALAISPDGTHVIAASIDATARVWETSGHQTAVFHTGNSGLQNVALSNNGKRAAGSSGTNIGAWDTEKDTNIFQSADLGYTHALEVSPDGHYAAFHYEGKSVEIWDLNAGKRLQSLQRQFIGSSTEMSPVFSWDSSHVLIVCDHQAKIAALHEEKEIPVVGRPIAAQFSFDGRRLSACYYLEPGAIIDVQNGSTLTLLPDEPRRLQDLFSFPEEKPPALMDPFGNGLTTLPSPQFSIDGNKILASDSKGRLSCWAFRRNESAWGMATRLEFWLTVVFVLLWMWSLQRDWKRV